IRDDLVTGVQTCALPILTLVFSIGSPANADVVTDWNNAALDAIRAGHTAPPIASRSLAILHASIYDAVNGIARTNQPYLVPSAEIGRASCREREYISQVA